MCRCHVRNECMTDLQHQCYLLYFILFVIGHTQSVQFVQKQHPAVYVRELTA